MVHPWPALEESFSTAWSLGDPSSGPNTLLPLCIPIPESLSVQGAVLPRAPAGAVGGLHVTSPLSVCVRAWGRRGTPVVSCPGCWSQEGRWGRPAARPATPGHVSGPSLQASGLTGSLETGLKTGPLAGSGQGRGSCQSRDACISAVTDSLHQLVEMWSGAPPRRQMGTGWAAAGEP